MRIFLSFLLWCMMVVPTYADDFSWRGFTKFKKSVDVTTISIEGPSGTMVGLGSFRGSWVLLNAWAAWCAPCVAELPTLERLSKNPSIPGVKVIAVSMDAGRKHDQVVSFLRQHGVGNFAAYSDPALLLDQKLRSTGLPMTYLIDPKGRVVAEYRGSAVWDAPAVVQDLKRVMSAGTI